MASPIRLISRCTRKNPTVGASTPTIAPAANASRMNSRSSMDVRRAVPDAGEARRRPVVDDPLADEDEAADELLHGAELVRDVQERHRQVAVEPVEERRERLLRLDVDPRRRLVEDEQRRARRERLRDERALLLPPREPCHRPPREVRHPDALQCLVDRLAVLAAKTAEQPERSTAGLDDLPDRRRRAHGDPRALREVADPR